MLVATDGSRIVPDAKETEIKAASELVFNKARTDPLFCYKYQITWLIAAYGNRLGNEFSGSAFKGYRRSTIAEAGKLLSELAGGKCLQVVVPALAAIPIVESTIRFQRLTFSFLPQGTPCLFHEDGTYSPLEKIAEESYESYEQAAHRIIRTITGA